MLKELSEDLNSIKKIESEIKDTLIEIKNNCRKTTIEWMKSRTKSMIWNIRKQNHNQSFDLLQSSGAGFGARLSL